jgi:hypothetical protein
VCLHHCQLAALVGYEPVSPADTEGSRVETVDQRGRVTEDPDVAARKALLEVVSRLDEQDIAPEIIVDALLSVSIAAVLRLIGNDAAASLFEEMAGDLRRDADGSVRH